jgi:hypothetical protein
LKKELNVNLPIIPHSLRTGIFSYIAYDKTRYKKIEAYGRINNKTGTVDSSLEEVKAVLGEIKFAQAQASKAKSNARINVFSLSDEHAKCVKNELLKQKSTFEYFLVDKDIDPQKIVFTSLGNSNFLSNDYVIFSVGFAKTKTGKMLSNFADFTTKEGYERFLGILAELPNNVSVITSLCAKDFEGKRSKSLKTLAHLLEMLELNESDSIGSDSHENLFDLDTVVEKNPLLEDIRILLVNNGYKASCGVTFDGSYIIPLVATNPLNGKMIAVINDNDRYIKEESIRYKNRLRAKELEAAGYFVVPVWTVSLFLNPKMVLNKIIKVLNE